MAKNPHKFHVSRTLLVEIFFVKYPVDIKRNGVQPNFKASPLKKRVLGYMKLNCPTISCERKYFSRQFHVYVMVSLVDLLFRKRQSSAVVEVNIKAKNKIGLVLVDTARACE